MLCRAGAGVPGAPALPARRADQARGPRAGRRGRPAGGGPGRVPGPLLPGRDPPRDVPRPPRARPRGRGRDRRRRRPVAGPPPRASRLHRRPAPRPRRRRARAALRARHRGARQPRGGGPPRRAEHRARRRARRRAAPLRARAWTAPSCATVGRPRARPGAPRGASTWSWCSPSPCRVRRRDRPPACWTASWSWAGARSRRADRRGALLDSGAVTSDEIRETFLSFFEQRDHLRLPSAPLVPATYDPSVLLTTAGMHPLKPYFLGREQPPHDRLTSCQKCFRTVDIEVVGTTTRHETFFEMLGNFSIGDYFKQGAAEYALGALPERLRASLRRHLDHRLRGRRGAGAGTRRGGHRGVAGGGDPAGAHRALPALGELLAGGSDRSVRPLLGALPGPRAWRWGGEDDLPGGDNERFLEYWNLVFMQYDQQPENVLTPLPFQNIDTGLGLERMAAIKQGVDSVFDTDNFRPLMELGEELSGRRQGEDEADRPGAAGLADHSRGMTFLIADGVVPSNEDRGYVLRRVMRRAVQRGRSLGMEPGFLRAYAERVREIMAGVYPRAGRAARGDRPVGRRARRRASGARWSRAPACSTSSSRARGRPERRESPPRTRSACTTPTVSPSTSRLSWSPSTGSASTSRASRRSWTSSANAPGRRPRAPAWAARRRRRRVRGLRGRRRIPDRVRRL